ncbi:Cof-type HAD-IIB family hydrolase [Gaetbulibacter sp. M235]|uniref:Cof-type HAD-IIB family hydrolase n=1 Tax=Gaetbulibacter sp. M235 TaxID=3126510 RepID=UPI00374E743C
MNYKLICSDIDGTLLDKDRALSVATIREIKRLSHIPFILISSRMPKAMRHLQEILGNTNNPIIAYNGGLILNQQSIIHSTEINNGVLESIINKSLNTSIHLSLYHADKWFVPSLDFWANREINNTKVLPEVKSNLDVLQSWKKENKGAHKIMCMGDEQEIDFLYKTLEAEHNDEIILYRSKSTYIEISHRSISKKTAIETLINHNYPDIEMHEVIAFGDNYNDIEMLKAVGLGVAVENAIEEVLKIAKKVTDTNKNDGVAKVLAEL